MTIRRDQKDKKLSLEGVGISTVIDRRAGFEKRLVLEIQISERRLKAVNEEHLVCHLDFARCPLDDLVLGHWEESGGRACPEYF